MEADERAMGMLKGGSKLNLLRAGVAGVLCLVAAATGATEECRAIFTGGLQTHDTAAVIFRQGAVLLDNPGNRIDTAQLKDQSAVPTCDRQSCEASGQTAGDLGELVYPHLAGLQSLRVEKLASAEAGADGQSRFRRLELEDGAHLSFNPRHQAYYIERLSLAKGAQVTLAPGRYWIGRLDMATGSELQVAGGSARVMLAASLNLSRQARINGDDQSFGPAERLQLFVRGNLTQGAGSVINALAYVAGDYRASTSARLGGAVNARGIDLGAAVRVEARMDAVSGLSWNDQCRARADLDSDGVLDLFDEDTDGDGLDDERERLTGSDPRDPSSGPATGYLNQCTGAFARGLQTHGGGRISFGVDARLQGAESAYLPAVTVIDRVQSQLPSCDTQACLASGRLASLPGLPQFLTTASSFRQDVEPQGFLELDGARTEWAGLRIGKQGRVRFGVPGEYRLGALDLGAQATLELTPGDYWVESLRLGSAARIQPIGGGTVRLHVRKGLQLPARGLINAGDDGQPGVPADMLILAEGKVVLGSDSIVSGFVYARDRLILKKAAQLHGGALGSDITLDTLARTHLSTEALRGVDFGALCDLDGDGIGDSRDPDRDGDGISNEHELQAGADPDDAASVPPDMDRDGIPDSLDDDRDGDGVANGDDVSPDDATESGDLDGDGIGDNADPDRDGDGASNEDEIAAGSSPDDASDFPDRQPPEIGSDGPGFLSVGEDTVSLGGRVSDAGSGLASLELLSERFPATRFAVPLQDGRWSVSVPLLEGINQLSLVARDQRGNQAQLQFTVERLPPVGDIGLRVDYPQSGAIVQDAVLVVSGLLRSDLPAQQLAVSINGQAATLSPTERATEYRFQSAAVTLQPGSNWLVLQGLADQRSVQRTLLVTYQAPQTSFAPPVLENLVPVDGSQLAERTFYLTGQIFAEAGLDTVTLNGRSQALREAGSQLLDLRELLSIPDGQESFSAELIARDRSGQETRRSLSWQLDQQPPQVMLEQMLVELPATNRVSEQPFPLSGTLREPNLASFRINGNDAALTPGAQPGEYRFATRLSLPLGQATSLVLEARDQAGNALRREYGLALASEASINWVIPTEGTELLNRGEPISLQIAARIADLSGQLHPRARLLSATGEPVTEVELSGDTSLKSATLVVPAQSGEYRLLAVLEDADQRVLAQSSRAISVVTPEQVPVALERISPANGEPSADPNEFISLYFNQSIDVSKLEVRVFETANGKTYVDVDGLGTSELQAQGYQLEDVNRNHQAVGGRLSVLPGDQVVAFYPEQDLAYNGEVTVEVRYDGQELERIRYRTRPLPTFISGVVLDQLQQPVVNVEVRIVELGRSTRTNRDGAFNFGFGDSAEQAIPGGRYQLQLNPQQSSLGHGSDSRTITVQGGALNGLGHLQLAQLNPALPHVPLRGGERFSLLDGEYLLDLGSARLQFPDGQQQGDAHVQMLGFGELPYPVEPLAMPFWMYAVQPAGIAVEGPFSVDLAALRLGESLDYLPEDGTYVAMVGLDREAGRIVPVGAGVIGNYRIRSVGPLALDNLALVGFALVGAEAQPALAAYASGEINLHQLQAELYRLNKGQ